MVGVSPRAHGGAAYPDALSLVSAGRRCLDASFDAGRLRRVAHHIGLLDERLAGKAREILGPVDVHS